MGSAEGTRAREIVTELLERVGKSEGPDGPVTDETSLYGDGLQLDSLEVAELSALLEDELQSDPFSTGDTMPERVGDIIAFYQASA